MHGAAGMWVPMTDEMRDDCLAGYFSPVDYRETENGTEVWVYTHNYATPASACSECGLLPLDYDGAETPCTV